MLNLKRREWNRVAPLWLTTVLLAVGAAFLCRFAFSLSPGWVYYDSMMQWHWALSLWQGGWAADLSPMGVTDHWPVFNTILKWVFLKLGLQPSGVALVQALGLYSFFAGGLLLLLRPKIFACVAPLVLMVFAYPLTRNFCVFHASDIIVTVAFLGFLLAWLSRQSVASSRLRKFCLVLAALFVGVSAQLRYNACISWLLFFMWAALCSRNRRLLQTLGAGIALSLVGYAAIAGLIQVQPSPVVADGFALRNFVMYSKTHDEGLRESLRGIVANPEVIPSKECIHGMYCHEYAQTNAVFPPPGSTGRVARAHFAFAVRHPLQFIAGTWPFVASQLGLSRPLRENEIGRHDYPSLFVATKMVYDDARISEAEAFQSTLEGPRSVLARPWIWFCVTLGLYAALQRRFRDHVFGLTWGLAFCYYFPFLWVGTLSELRFFFPSQMLLCFLLIYELALLADLSFGFVNKNKH